MPRILKFLYLGTAVLAAVAFLLGFYDYVIVGREEASFGGDVFLPIAVLGVIVALYMRRKRGMDARSRSRDLRESP